MEKNLYKISLDNHELDVYVVGESIIDALYTLYKNENHETKEKNVISIEKLNNIVYY